MDTNRLHHTALLTDAARRHAHALRNQAIADALRRLHALLRRAVGLKRGAPCHS